MSLIHHLDPPTKGWTKHAAEPPGNGRKDSVLNHYSFCFVFVFVVRGLLLPLRVMMVDVTYGSEPPRSTLVQVNHSH